jgi:hypothetical protein
LNVSGQEQTLLGTFYTNHNKPEDPYYSLLHPSITIQNTIQLLYINDATGNTSNKDKTEIDKELNYDKSEYEYGTGDLNLLTQEESPLEAELINTVTQTDTPMQQYLNKDLSDKVQWRNFKSLDITNSPDGKLYKMVQSNPEDKIDKVVLFDDNQQNNFSTTAFNPMFGSGIDLKTLFPDTDDPIGACLAYNDKLPDDFTDFQNDPKAQAFFALLARGDDVANLGVCVKPTDTTLYGIIQNLSNSDRTQWDSSKYDNYIGQYKPKLLLQNKGYRYSIN